MNPIENNGSLCDPLDPIESKGSFCNPDPVRVSRRFSIIHICLSTFTIVHSVYGVLTHHYVPTSTHFMNHTVQPTTEYVHISMIARISSSVLAILFSVLLYHGVTKRKSSYVKAYFIYGVISICISILSIGFLSIRGSLHGTVEYGFVALVVIISFFYTWVLVLIRRTYKIFEVDHDQYRSKLVDSQFI